MAERQHVRDRDNSVKSRRMGPNPMDVHRTKMKLGGVNHCHDIQVQITMYLENCISETHQAVNHRKEKIYRFQKKSKK